MSTNIIQQIFTKTFMELIDLSSDYRLHIDGLLKSGKYTEIQAIILKLEFTEDFIKQIKKEETFWGEINSSLGRTETLVNQNNNSIFENQTKADSDAPNRFKSIILSIIEAAGGRAKEKEINNRICIDFPNLLSDLDWQINKLRPDQYNWQADTLSTIKDLENNGFLKKSPYRHSWEITPSGTKLVNDLKMSNNL